MSLNDAIGLIVGVIVLPIAFRAFVVGFAGPLVNRAQIARIDGSRRWSRRIMLAGAGVLIGGSFGGLYASGWLLTSAGAVAIGVGLAASASGTYGPLLYLCYKDIVVAHRDALGSWAAESGLHDGDVIVGAREVAVRRRWRWYAVTIGLESAIGGGVYFATAGRDATDLQVAGVIFALGMATALVVLRVIDMAYPVGEFLERVGQAIRLAQRGERSPAVSGSLVEHQAVRRGAGAEALESALPALHRAVQALLRRHPAWGEDSVYALVTPVFSDLQRVTASGSPVVPGAETSRAIRLALLGEIPGARSGSIAIRAMSDDRGWNQSPSLLPGRIDRWLPVRLTQLAKVVVAAGAFATVVLGLVKGLTGF